MQTDFLFEEALFSLQMPLEFWHRLHAKIEAEPCFQNVVGDYLQYAGSNGGEGLEESTFQHYL
jgi:hypothetical protein